MSPTDFEAQLRTLDQTATLVRRRRERETWRFEHNGKLYFLHFYPSDGCGIGGSTATAEFAGLKTLQDFKLPAVRAAALLSGFRFGDRKGDAVITHGLTNAVRLDGLDYQELKLHLLIRDRLIEALQAIGKAGVGHRSLRLSSFLWHEGAVVMSDAVDLTTSGLKIDHLMSLAHDAGELATRADRVCVWRALVPNADVPPEDKKLATRIRRDLREDAVESVHIDDWHGLFRARSIRSTQWSPASKLQIRLTEWQREWPSLLKLCQADQLEILKRDSSGDVLGTTITLAGVPIDVVVKRPKNKFWYRYIYDCFRPSRAMRLWQKARSLQVRQIAVEYPLIVMERQRFGYVVEAIAVFEKVPGTTLDALDLDKLPPADRETLFRRCGRILRRIEETGLAHTDAKSSNWIIVDGTIPVLIDAYGLRPLNAFLQLFGIRRLLRAMREHPQYTPTDSRFLCQGFAPRAPLEVEDAH